MVATYRLLITSRVDDVIHNLFHNGRGEDRFCSIMAFHDYLLCLSESRKKIYRALTRFLYTLLNRCTLVEKESEGLLHHRQ